MFEFFTEQVCMPAWFVVISTIILMCAASAGRYNQGKIDGRIEEVERQMKENNY